MTLPTPLQTLVDAGFDVSNEQISAYMAEMKTCSSCNKTKARTEFYWGTTYTGSDGISSRCRTCETTKVRAAYDPVKTRQYDINRKFGLSENDYKSLLGAQGLRCAICKRLITDVGRKNTKFLHVDHDHITGLIRGLLCNHCNSKLLGIYAESKLIEIFKAAIDYLENPPAIRVLGERFVPEK